MKAKNSRRRLTTTRTTERHDTELSHQGLRVLARMVARRHLGNEVAHEANRDASTEVGSHSGTGK